MCRLYSRAAADHFWWSAGGFKPETITWHLTVRSEGGMFVLETRNAGIDSPLNVRL